MFSQLLRGLHFILSLHMFCQEFISVTSRELFFMFDIIPGAAEPALVATRLTIHTNTAAVVFGAPAPQSAVQEARRVECGS